MARRAAAESDHHEVDEIGEQAAAEHALGQSTRSSCQDAMPAGGHTEFGRGEVPGHGFRPLNRRSRTGRADRCAAGRARRGQRLEDLGGMLRVAGLDRHVDRHALGGHVEEQAAVRDLEDVGAELPEPARHRPSKPGRSREVMRNEAMRSSRSSSRTMTEARSRASMLPPHSTRPTRRPSKRSGSRQHGRKARPRPRPRPSCAAASQ